MSRYNRRAWLRQEQRRVLRARWDFENVKVSLPEYRSAPYKCVRMLPAGVPKRTCNLLVRHKTALTAHLL